MKHLLLLLSLLSLFGCQATLPDGETVGETIEPRNIIALATVDATPAEYFEQTLLVGAEAVAVCQAKGCWMKVQDGDADAMVRWEEGCGGKYAFPPEIVGKRIVIQGSFYPKVLSEEDAAHLQAEAGVLEHHEQPGKNDQTEDEDVEAVVGQGQYRVDLPQTG